MMVGKPDIAVTPDEVQITNTILMQVENMMNEGYKPECILKSIHLAGASLMAQIKNDFLPDDYDDPDDSEN